MAEEPAKPARSLFPDAAVKSVARVPAYALVFVSLISIITVATQVQLAVAIVIVVAVVALSAWVIWVVELRSVATASSAQTGRLQQVADLDQPIRCVFEELVGENDTYVVHSSTEVKEFVDQVGATVIPDDLSYGGGPEKRVTTIPDAIGAGKINNLLYLGGKRARLRPITSWPDDFKGEYWESSLILIGSGKSNQATTKALHDFESPYRFNDEMDAIVDVASPGSQWPADKDELRTKDYGILVKLKVERAGGTSVYLVIAGVGPYGTLAGCVFLERQIERIYTDYDTNPFAYLLSVGRDGLGYFEPKVERHCGLPVARR